MMKDNRDFVEAMEKIAKLKHLKCEMNWCKWCIDKEKRYCDGRELEATK